MLSQYQAAGGNVDPALVSMAAGNAASVLNFVGDALRAAHNLRGVSIGEANLNGCVLSGGDFRCADFGKSTLCGAQISFSDFRGARLRGAVMSGFARGPSMAASLHSRLRRTAPRDMQERDVFCVTVCPDEKHALVGCHDGCIELFDVSARDGCLRVFRGHSGIVTSVSGSNDLSRIVSCASDGVRVWQGSSGRLLQHTPAVRVSGLQISSDGSRVVSFLWREITLWSFEGTTMAAERSVPLATSICCVALSPQRGNEIAVGGVGGSIFLVDWACGEVTRVFVEFSPVVCLAYSGDGNYLASHCSEGKVHVRDLRGGFHRVSFSSADLSECCGLMFSSSELRVCLAEYDVLISLHTNCWKSLPDGHSRRVSDLLFSSDLKTLLTCSEEREVRVWNAETGVCQRVFEFRDMPRELCFAYDGTCVAVRCLRHVSLLDLSNGHVTDYPLNDPDSPGTVPYVVSLEEWTTWFHSTWRMPAGVVGHVRSDEFPFSPRRSQDGVHEGGSTEMPLSSPQLRNFPEIIPVTQPHTPPRNPLSPPAALWRTLTGRRSYITAHHEARPYPDEDWKRNLDARNGNYESGCFTLKGLDENKETSHGVQDEFKCNQKIGRVEDSGPLLESNCDKETKVGLSCRCSRKSSRSFEGTEQDTLRKGCTVRDEGFGSMCIPFCEECCESDCSLIRGDGCEKGYAKEDLGESKGIALRYGIGLGDGTVAVLEAHSCSLEGFAAPSSRVSQRVCWVSGPGAGHLWADGTAFSAAELTQEQHAIVMNDKNKILYT
eukprot:Rmarinus@m.4177